MEHLIEDGLYTITGPHEVDDISGFGVGCVVRYGNDFNDENQYKMWDILEGNYWWINAGALTKYKNPFQVGDVIRLADWVNDFACDSGRLDRYRGVLYTVKEINGDHIVVADVFSSTLFAPLFELVERPADTETSLPREITSALNGTISRNQFLSWLFKQEKLADNISQFELHRLMDDIISLVEFASHTSMIWEHIRREKDAIQQKINLTREEITALEARIASLEKELGDYD